MNSGNLGSQPNQLENMGWVKNVSQHNQLNLFTPLFRTVKKYGNIILMS